LEALIPLLGKISDIGLLISVLGNVGMAYLHVVWRREERDDRRSLLETVNKNTDALYSVRNVLSARTGTPL
jgi:rRNA processing protein Gar1